MTRRDLTSGWAAASLGDLLVTIRGVSYAKEQALAVPAPGFVPILRATNIDQKLNFEDFVFVPKALVAEEQLLRPGDIVIAASSGSKKVVGKAAQLLQNWEGSFGAFCMGIRPRQEIEPRFIGYFLQSDEYRHRISDLSAGSNINNLKREHIESFPFRLAPLNEQRRIAEKIEELLSDLDASVAALGRARANLKRYRAAVLKAAVEGKLTAEWRKANPPKEPADKLLERILVERRKKWEETQLSKYAAQGKKPPSRWRERYQEPRSAKIDELPLLPDGWTWSTLEQLCDEIVDCEHSTAKFTSQGVPCLDTTCMRPQEIITEKLRFVDERTYLFRVRRLIPRKGDLVFAREGTVGTVVVIPEGFRCCLGQRVMLFRPHHDIAAQWLATAIDSELFRAQYRPKILGTTSPHLNVGDIKELAVPLAPQDEQVAILEKLGGSAAYVNRIESALVAELSRASRLRQSILKRAFEGKLVPQDPNDEPASVLLERIRAARASGQPPGNSPGREAGKARHQRPATANTSSRGKKKVTKRDVFAEVSEGADALKGERDA